MWASQLALVLKDSPANAGDMGPVPELGRLPGGGRATHSSSLDWRIHGHRRLAGYNPSGHKESDTTVATAHIRVIACIHHHVLYRLFSLS